MDEPMGSQSEALCASSLVSGYALEQETHVL